MKNSAILQAGQHIYCAGRNFAQRLQMVFGAVYRMMVTVRTGGIVTNDGRKQEKT